MTLPPVVRIFFAIELPEVHKQSLARYIGDLKKLSKSQGIRWTRPDNLHITLQFLAEVKSEHISNILDEVRKEVDGFFAHTSFNFTGIQIFPNPYRPRVIVLEVTPQDQLAQLSETIGRGIQKMGYEIEDRPFRAHLTLGRIKQPKGVDLHFLDQGEKLDLEQIEIQEVALFRSEPQPQGSLYTVLGRISL